jgi:hypothetical protein
MDAMHDPWTERLSDYLDGELAAGDAHALERHLVECAACRLTLEDLRTVVARARSLPATPPAMDLWPAIEARLADTAQESAPVMAEPGGLPARRARPTAAPRVLDVRQHPRWWSRPLTFSLAQAAAAAVLLVVLAGGGAWLAFRAQPERIVAGEEMARRTDAGSAPGPVASTSTPLREPTATSTPDRAPAGTPAASRAGRRPAPSDGVTATTVSLDPQYDATVAELQQLLRHERSRLDTSTVRILEQNLALVDRALAEAQRAVAADPNNPHLRSYLASTMRRKVDLLRRATVIAGAQG